MLSYNTPHQYSHFKEFTYTFKTNISRVYAFMKSILYIKMITINNSPFKLSFPSTSSPCSPPDEIEGLFSDAPIKFYIQYNTDLPEHKQITYIIKFEDGNIINCNIHLYAVGNQCSSYFIAKFNNDEIYSKTNTDQINLWYVNVLQKMENLLAVNPFELKQFESTIITANMNDIWEFVLNIQKLKNVAPMIDFNVGENLDWKNIKKGQEIKASCYCANNVNQKIEYKIKVLSFDRRERSNKWCFAFETIQCEKLIPSQIVVIRLIKVNTTDCQLSIYHEFKEVVSNDLFYKLSYEKKYLLNELKDFLENIKGVNCG